MKRYSYIICISIAVFLLIVWLIYLVNRDNYCFVKTHEEILFLVDNIIAFIKQGNDNEIAKLLMKNGYYQIGGMPLNASILESHSWQNFDLNLFKVEDINGFLLNIGDREIIAITYRYCGFGFYIVSFLFFCSLFLICVMSYYLNKFSVQHDILHSTIQNFVGSNFAIDSRLDNSTKGKMKKISMLIRNREFILRTIGHEIRAPITKMKLIVALLSSQNSQSKDNISLLRNYLGDLHVISENTLKLEQTLSFDVKPNYQNFSSDTLLIESLNRFDDERDNISLKNSSSFIIYGDLHMLRTSLWNLIHNALKYSINRRVSIEVIQNQIIICNIANRLQHDINYYLQPFSRDPNSNATGYGLGLYIVSEILRLHDITLSYHFEPTSFCDDTFNVSLSEENSKRNIGIHKFSIIFDYQQS